MANTTLTQTGAQVQADLNKVEELANVKSIGSGLSLSSAGQLSASGGSSGKYLHHIGLHSYVDGDYFASFEFINSVSTEYTTVEAIAIALYGAYYSRPVACVMGGGSVGDAYDEMGFYLLSVCAYPNNTLRFTCVNSQGELISKFSTDLSDLGTIDDKVIAL